MQMAVVDHARAGTYAKKGETYRLCSGLIRLAMTKHGARLQALAKALSARSMPDFVRARSRALLLLRSTVCAVIEIA